MHQLFEIEKRRNGKSVSRRCRRPLLSLAAMVAGAAGLPPCSVEAVPYAFTNIADTSGPIGSFVFRPTISNSGTAAFVVNLDAGGQAILKGNGGALTTIADTTGPFSTFITVGPPVISINSSDTVAFIAVPDIGGDGVYKGDGGPTITVAEFGHFIAPSINDSGTVAYFGLLTDGSGFGYSAVNGGTGTVIARIPSDISSVFGLPTSSINSSNQVAFQAVSPTVGPAVFVGNGSALTTIADMTGPIATILPFTISINDSGTVSFAASLDAGGIGVFKGNGGGLTAIVDTSGPYSNIASSTMNNAGGIAFYASIDTGGSGIFTGANPASDAVIKLGNSLFGSSVININPGVDYLNDNGQIAFGYTLANGLSGIAVATPLPLPPVPPGFEIITASNGVLGRISASDGSLLGLARFTNSAVNGVDVVLGPDRHIYVSDIVGSVHRVNGRTLEQLDVFATNPGGCCTTGIAFGPDGSLYVAQRETHTINRFDGQTGEFIGVFANTGTLRPEDIVVGPDGYLYATNHRDPILAPGVVRFDLATGANLGLFTSGKTIVGGRQIAFGPDGHLYVNSLYTNEVLRFNGTTGQFINVVSNLPRPNGLQFGPDGSLFISSEQGSVFRIDPRNGQIMSQSAPFGFLIEMTLRQVDGAPLISLPAGLAIDGTIGGGPVAIGGVDVQFPSVLTAGTFSGDYFLTEFSALGFADDFSFLPAGSILQHWELEFDGTFDGLATLVFGYDDTFFPVGFNELSLTIYHQSSEGRWVPLEVVSRDTWRNTITVLTDGFSPFALGVSIPEPCVIILMGPAFASLLSRRRKEQSSIIAFMNTMG